MKSKIAIFCAAWLCCVAALAQTGKPAPKQKPTRSTNATKPAASGAQSGAATAAPAAKSGGAGDLQTVLNDMDHAASGFKTAQADFVWDQFTKVVNEHDQQKGVVYYRRLPNEVQMTADITAPAKKYVLFSGGMVNVYQP